MSLLLSSRLRREREEAQKTSKKKEEKKKNVTTLRISRSKKKGKHGTWKATKKFLPLCPKGGRIHTD